MVFCAVCKENKGSSNHWFIQERSVDNNLVNRFKMCDDCAGVVLRRLAKKVLGMRSNQPVTDTLILNKMGLVDEIILMNSNELELNINLDFSKAKCWVEKVKAGDPDCDDD